MKKLKPKQSRPYIIISIILLSIGLAAFIYQTHYFDFTQDDAYITFRYAANYLNGDGLVYNAGEHVEGYTNFLWTVFMILAGLIGYSYPEFASLLGAAFGIGAIFVAYFLALHIFGHYRYQWRYPAAGIVAIIMGATYSFAYWTVSGLESAAFTFFVLTGFYAFQKRYYIFSALLTLATLTRPEGGLILIFLIAYEIVKQRRITRLAAFGGALYCIFLLPFAGFKILYYHSLLPNPFYAKTAFNLHQIWNGLEYSGMYMHHYWAFGILIVPGIIAAIWRNDNRLRLTALLMLVYIVYIVLIGGDVLKVHRFFVPIMAIIGIITIYGFITILGKWYYIVPAIIVLLGWQTYFPRDHVLTFYNAERGLARKMNNISNRLKQIDTSDFTIAITTIGLSGYNLRGHRVIDILGLTDSTIARHPQPPIEGLESSWRETQYNVPYLLSQKPDYILFSTGAKPSAPAERALYCYTAFLNNYRTICVSGGYSIHSIFKRYYPLPDKFEQDVSSEFVQNYSKGLNLLRAQKNFPEAMDAFITALQFSPKPEYPYIHYLMGNTYLYLNDFKASYAEMIKVIESDTLVFEAYKDLYYYNFRTGNEEKAAEYRAETARLIPWYIPHLDSIVTGKIRLPND